MRPLAASLLLLIALHGCRHPCSDELEKGSTYTATIAGPYGDGTRFPGPRPFTSTGGGSCEGFDGLDQGDRVTILAAHYFEGGNMSCDTLAGEILEAPATVRLEAPIIPAAPYISIAAASVVTTGGCRGFWGIDLVQPPETKQGIFSEPVEGERPGMLLHRTFRLDLPMDGCRSCEDWFAVKLEKR